MDEAMVRWAMVDEFGADPSPLPSAPPWAPWAACRGVDTDLFFGGKGRGYKAAQALCDDCPVRTECLEHAMDLERHDRRSDRKGVWGGLTPNQRAALQRERRAHHRPQDVAPRPARCACRGGVLDCSHDGPCPRDTDGRAQCPRCRQAQSRKARARAA